MHAHAAQRIENLMSLQQAFLVSQKSLLANASHELRSPLACIRMGLEFMGEASPIAKDEIARNIAESLELLEGVQSVEVLGVAKLLRRMVRNLLENANRYGGQFDEGVGLMLSQSNVTTLLSVCDRGPGVPVELRERIFEPFYRLPGASERTGGMGLGLALVKSIAQRHGGQESCLGREGARAGGRVLR